MHKSLLLAVVSAAISFGVSAAHAQLLYSFEPGDSPNQKDGFVDNGLFPAASSTGATVGVGALQLSETGGGYNGSYTQQDLPAPLSNPNLVGFTADVTISANDPAFTGTFANLGMGLFIANPGESEYGYQYIAATSTWPNLDLSPGTYYGLYFTLGGEPTDPDTNTQVPWGTLLADGWVPSGFNIVDANNGTQTFYVDNIQAVVPEPASLGALASTGCLMLIRRRRKI
jgi:hypothetical protein